jgi:hypothetical protein
MTSIRCSTQSECRTPSFGACCWLDRELNRILGPQGFPSVLDARLRRGGPPFRPLTASKVDYAASYQLQIKSNLQYMGTTSWI